jgi:hypothetical protein
MLFWADGKVHDYMEANDWAKFYNLYKAELAR